MMALAAETRKTDNPYRIQELPQINMSIVRSPVEVDDKATVLENFKLVSTSATTKKRGKALDVSNDTPTGVVRNIFIGAADRSLTIDQILAAVPEGVPFEVSKDFIYRALPRMVKRKEILRTDKGKYRYNESFA